MERVGTSLEAVRRPSVATAQVAVERATPVADFFHVVGILGFLVAVALSGLAFYLWRKNKISKVATALGGLVFAACALVAGIFGVGIFGALFLGMSVTLSVVLVVFVSCWVFQQQQQDLESARNNKISPLPRATLTQKSQVAPAQGHIDPKLATVGPPPAPRLQGDDATVRAQSLANYKALLSGTATEDRVDRSSAVRQGWAAADRDTQAEGRGLTRRSSAMTGVGVVAEAARAGLGEESLTDEELAMQFLFQEVDEEERHQREDETSLTLARELKHDVDPSSAPPLEEVHVAGELLEPLAQDADQHAGPGQVQKNQALDKDAEAIVEQALRMQVPILFFVRAALVCELLVACAIRLKSDTRTQMIFIFCLLNQQLLHAERLSLFESLSLRRHVLLIDELLNEADRTANTEQQEKKMQETMTAMEKDRAAEMQEKLAVLQEQAKAEQARLQLAVEEKMAAMEEANRRGNEERERIAQEKAKLEAEKAALDALAAEKQSLEAQWEELRKKEQEISAKEELLAKQRAQRNEAMAEIALLKAQLAQVKHDQETSFQEVPPVHPPPVPPSPPSLLFPLSPSLPLDKVPCHPRL
jgi:hypothetical protein